MLRKESRPLTPREREARARKRAEEGAIAAAEYYAAARAAIARIARLRRQRLAKEAAEAQDDTATAST